MIIQCPACATKYVVPDTAIGVDGRTVRCAKCKHSWFQDGPEIEVPARDDEVVSGAPPIAEAAPAAATEPEPEPDPVPAPPPPEPEPQVEPEQAAKAEDATEETLVEPPSTLVDRIRPPQHVDADEEDLDEPSHFDHEPPFRPRRNPLKLWSWAAGIFAIVAAATIFAVSYWGLPDWVPVDQPTFAAGDADLQLDFPQDQQERRTLPNNTEFFGASGTITNIGTTTRPIPTILIVLRDSRDRIVYSWEVPPPQRTLAPGETVTVNEAVTDIPRSAREVQIGWKPE